MAKITKAFQAVPAGEIYPVEYQPGDECPKDLEATAAALDALEAPKDAKPTKAAKTAKAKAKE